MQIILIFFAIKYLGNWDAIYKALENKERVSLSELSQTETLIKNSEWKIVTILDLEYPNLLKTAFKPPFVIWMTGDISVLEKPLLCLTGNNSSSTVQTWVSQALANLTEQSNLLVRDFSAVDLQVVREAKTQRLFVLPSGLKTTLTNINVRKNDLVISEYPPEAAATKQTFRDRNRLLAALAYCLVLFSSHKDNGINNLVNNFLNLGKEVYCYPGSGTENDGNTELVKQGASLITAITEVVMHESM